MQLTKLHGLGNDFLVSLSPPPSLDVEKLARALCHRTHGLGADGLIFGSNIPDPAAVADGRLEVGFTLYNSDGSQAEISGNGMRCFAHAVARHVGRDTLELRAATLAGTRNVSVALESGGALATASVQMGPMAPLALTAERIAEIDALFASLPGLPPVQRWGTGDMGNPHVVLEVGDPYDVDLATVGAAIERDFGGINVHFVASRGGDGIDMRVWERGAGITEACGSGACAVGATALGWGIGTNPVDVHMPGGSATIALDDASSITLTGPSVLIADINAIQPMANEES